jgi:hypothetical protein
MYISAMLRDERFRGNGHIMRTPTGLPGREQAEGSLSVMNAVDVLRLLIIGDVGGV